MADTAVAEVPTRKARSNRRALKDKNPSGNEANIQAGKVSEPDPSPIQAVSQADLAKENHESLSQPRASPKKSKSKAAASKKQSKETQSSFEKDLQEMQEKLQEMRLEKEKTEELLKEKDEILKLKEEELETKGREQDKLQMELKKLQKLKEFKPTMAFPIVQSLNDKKKKGCPEKKRPAPPYVLWCKDQWNEIKKENPEAEFKEISNILGAKWKNVTAEEKKPYEERYQAEKEAYLQVTAKEKRETEAMHLLEEEHKQKTAMELLEQYLQKEKDPLKPKQPMSAFFLFTNERRAALVAESKTVPEIAKITGEEWKNMTDKQKRPYEERAKKNKEKYMQEMEVYKQTKEEEASSLKKEEEELMKLQKHEALQLLKKKEKTENIIKPKKPASSYILFSKEARKSLLEERPGTNSSTITALISVKWKELSEEERKPWNDKAAEAMEAYKKELEEYNKSVAASAAATSLC
ncbi:high mobility group B protein 6-like [Prunus yedoensis var. nudiflora]|uniref:High mobility group B protein 6-like n=1 Tax=Prunus yedoensis var. nudiflora TaxID=2094558 RepID=A0A314UYK8_PRUYE|nr:high mobility group B protein 6-like [Prunus yedoensis var. nudiflora]